jgi:hypothetical protein
MLDPLEFLARLVTHIPDKRQAMTRYYGWFANRPRGVGSSSSRNRAPAAGRGGSVLREQGNAKMTDQGIR